MSKKVIAAVLILANLMTLASCSQAANSDETTAKSRKSAEAADEEPEDDDDGNNKIAEDRVYSCIDKITTALAECDYDGFASSAHIHLMRSGQLCLLSKKLMRSTTVTLT